MYTSLLYRKSSIGRFLRSSSDPRMPEPSISPDPFRGKLRNMPAAADPFPPPEAPPAPALPALLLLECKSMLFSNSSCVTRASHDFSRVCEAAHSRSSSDTRLDRYLFRDIRDARVVLEVTGSFANGVIVATLACRVGEVSVVVVRLVTNFPEGADDRCVAELAPWFVEDRPTLFSLACSAAEATSGRPMPGDLPRPLVS